MLENVQNLAKDIHLQIQEAEQAPNITNLKKSLSRHIIVKVLRRKKTKRKKNSWKQPERNITFCIGEQHFTDRDFSSEIIGTTGKWHIFFKHLKKRTVNPKSYTWQKYPSKLKGKLRYFYNKENKGICYLQSCPKRMADWRQLFKQKR